MQSYADVKEAIKKSEFQVDWLSDEQAASDWNESLNIVAEVFIFLSLIYRYPSNDVYNTIKEHISGFSDIIDNYIGGKLELEDQVNMESEYVRLFVNDAKGKIVAPYVSCFTDKKGLLCGDDFEKMRDMLNTSGFVLSEDISELEDHICVVLELVYNLITLAADSKDAESINSSLRALLELNEKFLPVIAGEFADKVLKKTELDFYKKSSMLLKNFLGSFDSLLEEIIYETSIKNDN